MKQSYSILYFFILVLLCIFYFIHVYQRKKQENFEVTWTPYVIDNYHQPGYSNYFYHNNYMYPVY
jgi:hypothetical protein